MKIPAENYYDERATQYDEDFDKFTWRVYDALTWKYLKPYLPRQSNAVVLDAGGGTGRWSIPIAETGCRVHLVDISEGMLRQAEEKIRQKGLQDKITVRRGNITKLDYANETFDLVFADQVLFLFANKDDVVQEFHRVLKRGSPMVVSAPNRYVMSLIRLKENPDFALDLLEGKTHNMLESPIGTKVQIYRVTPDELREICTRSGFEVEKIVGKLLTMPIFLKEETSYSKLYSQELLEKILKMETILCERQDALGLAQTLQVIARKK